MFVIISPSTSFRYGVVFDKRVSIKSIQSLLLKFEMCLMISTGSKQMSSKFTVCGTTFIINVINFPLVFICALVIRTQSFSWTCIIALVLIDCILFYFKDLLSVAVNLILYFFDWGRIFRKIFSFWLCVNNVVGWCFMPVNGTDDYLFDLNDQFTKNGETFGILGHFLIWIESDRQVVNKASNSNADHQK